MVEKGRHPFKAKNDNAGEFDDRFKNVDLKFFEHRRIEIDAILAKVGGERFFEFIMFKLKAKSPKRNYNRAIPISTKLFNKDNFDLLPEPIQKQFILIQQIADVATKETRETIKTELSYVAGFIDVVEKKKEIMIKLADAISENEKIKEISSECKSSQTIGAMIEIIDEPRKNRRM